MYNIGKRTSPPIAMTVAICNGFLAYRSRYSYRQVVGGVTPFTFYSAAVLSVLAIIPYTILFMDPRANNLLLSLGNEVRNGLHAKALKSKENEVRETLMVWKRMNAIRALCVGLGAVLTTLATIFDR